MESIQGLLPGSILERYQVNHEIRDAGGLAIIEYMREFPSDMPHWLIMEFRHQEPMLSTHEPDCFSAAHNAWLARVLDTTPEEVLHIYQADPTIQRLVAEVLDDPELPHYGEISPTLPPSYCPPPRYSPPRASSSRVETPPRASSSRFAPGSPPRRVPRAQRNNRPARTRASLPPAYSALINCRATTPIRHNNASDAFPRSPPREEVRRPRPDGVPPAHLYGTRTPPQPAPEGGPGSSRAIIVPAQEFSDHDDATADENFTVTEDDDSDLEDLPDADLVKPFAPDFEELLSPESDSDEWAMMEDEFAEFLDGEGSESNDDDEDVEQPEVPANTPASTAYASRGSSTPLPKTTISAQDSFDWLAPHNRIAAMCPDPATLPSTPDWVGQGKAYQRARSTSMQAENERRKSIIQAHRYQSPVTPSFGADVETVSEDDTEMETEAELEGFAEQNVERGNKKSAKPATPRRTSVAQRVRKPSTRRGPAKRTRSRTKAKTAKKWLDVVLLR